MLKCSLYVSRAKVYLNLVKLIFLIFHVYRVLEGYHRPAVQSRNREKRRSEERSLAADDAAEITFSGEKVVLVTGNGLYKKEA